MTLVTDISRLTTSTPPDPTAAGPDLVAMVEQSSVDKLVASATYPVLVWRHREGFHPIPTSADNARYTTSEGTALLAEALKRAGRRLDLEPPLPEDQVYVDIVRAASETVETARACLRARDEAETNNQTFTGPERAVLQAMLDNGIARLAEQRGVEFRAHLAAADVFVRDVPKVTLNGPRLELKAIITGSATGELWWYHPTFHCSSRCFNWTTTWSWDRVGSLSVGPVPFRANMHADAFVGALEPALVRVRGVFDLLRLDYLILDKIAIEAIANRALQNTALPAFDAAKYVATVPLLGSKFRISSVELPATTGRIAINMTLAQL